MTESLKKKKKNLQLRTHIQFSKNVYEGIREAQVFNCPPLWVLVRRSLLSCHFYIWC